MPNPARQWTRAEVLALPDDRNRYELVDGELLVSPSPRAHHQFGVLELFRIVDPYVRAQRFGGTMLAPADLDLRSGQLVQPDLFVTAWATGQRPEVWEAFAIPLLVAEILSPTTARYDRITKRRRYQRSGVPTYWVVDLDARLVEVWTPDDQKPAIVDGLLPWNPPGASAPLTVDLPAYFSEVGPSIPGFPRYSATGGGSQLSRMPGARSWISIPIGRQIEVASGTASAPQIGTDMSPWGQVDTAQSRSISAKNSK